MKFAEKVEYLRKKSLYTQEELAAKVGISQPQVQAYESGRAKPKAETAIKLSKALGLTVEELLREE